MAENAERGRAAITASFEQLAKARENKAMSLLPQLFTEYKADEIVNIYQGKSTQKEKDFLVDLLGRINASGRIDRFFEDRISGRTKTARANQSH